MLRRVSAVGARERLEKILEAVWSRGDGYIIERGGARHGRIDFHGGV